MIIVVNFKLCIKISFICLERFLGWKKGDAAFKTVAAHGFNVWEPNPKCIIANSTKKDCSGIDAARECEMKFMTHEAGMYVRFFLRD